MIALLLACQQPDFSQEWELDRLRLLAIRADLPVLLCTGYSDLVDGAAAAAIGVRRYLSKPIAIATLVQAVIDELPPTNPRESRGH